MLVFPETLSMSGAPVKKLPASPSVSSPSVPVADRGGEEVDIGFSDLRTGSGDQLRDPRAGHKGRCATVGSRRRATKKCSSM
jgi:hypothetical protein